jgi:quercetin dioxygenase-like cupin family protein
MMTRKVAKPAVNRSLVPRTIALVGIGVILSFLIAPGSEAARGPGDAKEAVVFTGKLSEIPGKRLAAVRVDYPPGGKSGRHRHARSVFAYILSGAVRSQNSATGPERVYRAGEAFFEPSGSTHLVSENASTTEPASFLAVFVSDDGATPTTADP